MVLQLLFLVGIHVFENMLLEVLTFQPKNGIVQKKNSYQNINTVFSFCQYLT